MPETPQTDQLQVQGGDVLARIEQINPDVFHRAVAEVQAQMLQKRLREIGAALADKAEEEDEA